MNKELTNLAIESQDAFTVELGQAVDDILNNLSDAELSDLLTGEDHTFLNQVTPEGEPLVSASADESTTACVYAWSSFTLTTSLRAATSIIAVPHHGASSGGAANRQDLALAA